MRKELKRRAKENLKKHYLMVLVICLFASFCGVEYGTSTIRYHMDNIEYTSIGQLYETIVVNSDFKETVDRIANGEGDQVRKEIRPAGCFGIRSSPRPAGPPALFFHPPKSPDPGAW